MNREDRAAQLVGLLVGQRTGLIRHLNFVERIDGDAALHFAGATIANAHPVWGNHDGLNVGGCGATRHDAMIATLCEGLERYAASSHDDSGSCQRLDELDAPAIGGVDSSQNIRWVEGTNLSSGARCWVPASTVYVFYQPASDETMPEPGHSSGLACADSLDQAIDRGVCELIERDALSMTWLCGVSPPRVESDIVESVVIDLAPADDDVRVYDLTTDIGVPVVLVVCRGPSPFGQIIATGCACHPDPREALRHAMKEASQTRVYVRLLIEQDPYWQVDPDFSNVNDFSLHARLYTGRPKLVGRAFSFLDENDKTSQLFNQPPQGDVNVELKNLIDGAVVDLTPREAESASLYVVRVVAPSLFPLFGDRQFVDWNHPRLNDWQSVFPNGVKKHEHEVWPYPHPFP